MKTRGTTQLGRRKAAHSKPTDTSNVLTDRLAPLLTPGLRPELLDRWNRHAQDPPVIHPGSSGGNFNRFPPGGGFSLRPPLPCRLSPVYFPPSSPVWLCCSLYYPQNWCRCQAAGARRRHALLSPGYPRNPAVSGFIHDGLSLELHLPEQFLQPGVVGVITTVLLGQEGRDVAHDLICVALQVKVAGFAIDGR